jgi:hypothetical protein
MILPGATIKITNPDDIYYNFQGLVQRMMMVGQQFYLKGVTGIN